MTARVVSLVLNLVPVPVPVPVGTYGAARSALVERSANVLASRALLNETSLSTPGAATWSPTR